MKCGVVDAALARCLDKVNSVGGDPLQPELWRILAWADGNQNCIYQELQKQRGALTLDNPSQTTGAIHRLKEEIDKLTQQQSDALQLATLVGMTPDEAEEYDQRRQKILGYVQDLKILEESQ